MEIEWKNIRRNHFVYNTDLRTLYAINTEAFLFIRESYVALTDTILVPTFPSQAEVNELKAKDAYQKSTN